MVWAVKNGIPGSQAIDRESHSRCQVSEADPAPPPDLALAVMKTPASPTANRGLRLVRQCNVIPEIRIVSV